MTGIDDVARAVGLSTATVSRALRDLPGVAPSTRDRVIHAAAELGYVASPAASILASGQTRTIAVVVPFVTRWFFGEVIEGAESLLRKEGYDVLLYNLGGDPVARHRVLQTHLLTKRVDGILILGLDLVPHELAWLSTHAPPIAIVGPATEGIPSVGIDDEAAARTATQHLLDLGHRRIAYIGGSDEEPLSFSTPQHRLRGYRGALTAAGILPDPELETMGHFTMAGGMQAGLELLALRPRPTAIVCASDEMALGALHAARRAAVSVPDGVSVVGIDDHPQAAYEELSTVRQCASTQGRFAAEALLAGLRGEPTNRSLVLPTELVVRRSTARPRVELHAPSAHAQ